jgi:serine/threonine protein phosphatase PrpC
VAPRLEDAETFLCYVYEQLHKETWWRMDGCTVTIGLLYRSGHAVLATLGDSPWLVNYRKSRAIRGPTHNVNTNPADRARAVKLGARYRYPYLYVDHVGLQLTRALGDSTFKDVLERAPEITVLPRRRRGAWIALITDGVWDELFDDSDLTFTALVQSLCTGANAEYIVKNHGLEKKDDRAAVVCRFE